ncbi:MAG: TIR domain-containing protein [Okeania sp. SIO2G4]|uniref:TIR domain-containing protein n=1 Tax=unclassified Okeania TaxID=2634635 RepID=UPI0013BC924A|nr:MULTISPECIES: TIR domain-containing protein [unclassified Okeania]NEP71779.1 TIR domain-containing protein [Okeania sp. SIO2G5]NEP92449.1 TIR domain-containing protein [Okeania sp. SIO2F5]NEQ90479.1 TIR domain-containing protein [Okeania sp. SIO2G4]
MSEYYNAFISYGRADSKSFATKLYEKLTENVLKIWFDQNDIPLGVDFQNQIDDGIIKADNFLFIIAPHSVNSPYCLKEIELAIKYNKRIIPLLHVEQINYEIWQERNPQGTLEEWEVYQEKGKHSSFPNMHSEIGRINWVYFRENIDNFDKSLTDLIALFNRHQDYVKQHTKILVKGLDWENNQKQTRYLLIGKERLQAEQWLKIKFTEEQPPCIPTDLHCEFICESDKNANNLMTQVFLAFAEANKSFMEQIRKSLIREGITVWSSHADIKTGKDFQIEINQGIAGADNLIYLLSPEAIKSEYCQQELTYALSLNKRIIPLLISPTDLTEISPEISNLQFIDFTASEPEGIDKLLKELKSEAVYYQRHKILLVKALKWLSQNRNPSILLRGYNLEQSQSWLELAGNRTANLPTYLQTEFIAESAKQPPNLVLDVFVSYSRADSDFARQLNEALQTQGKTTWFDQESIATGTDFQQEINRGIEQSDNFLFIISPDSVNSPYCGNEVEYAKSLNKRFVTVLYRKVDSKELHPELAKVQWLDFHRYGGEFYTNFSELVRFLDTDRDYVRNHTKFSQQALDWEEKASEDLLLRGSELAIAKNWLQEALNTNKQPPLNKLQKKFIEASDDLHTSIQQARAKRRQLDITTAWGITVGSLLAVMISTGLWQNSRHEHKKAQLNLAQSLARSSSSLFVGNKELEASIEVIKAGKNLQRYKVKDAEVIDALQQSVYSGSESNRLQGHKNSIRSLSFSPDGKILASGSDDKQIKLWNMETGAEIRTFSGHDRSVISVCFSADGKILASAGKDKKIKLWDVETGKEIDTFSGHTDWINSMNFSPDGKILVSGSKDNTIKLWNVETGKEIYTLFGHQDSVISISFSPDGKTLVSGSKDKTIKFWDVETGREIYTLFGHNGLVSSVRFSPDGKILASGSYDKTVKLWDLETGEEIRTLTGHFSSIMSVSFSPNGKHLATGSKDRIVKLWDIETGNEIRSFYGHDAWAFRVSFSPDGKILASGSGDKTIRLWNLETRRELSTLKGHDDSIQHLSFPLASSPQIYKSEKEMIFVSGGADKTVKIWDLKTKTQDTLKGHDDSVMKISVSPDGKTIASAGEDSTIILWDVETKQEIHRLEGHTDAVKAISFSPDGNILASGSKDTTIKLWNWITKEEIGNLKGHESTVMTMSFSPDGKTLASGSKDNIINLWNIETMEKMEPLINDNQSSNFSVSFSPDGKTLAAGGDRNLVTLWDVEKREKVFTFKGHSSSINSVSFSPDGKILASGSSDKTIKLWNPKQGNSILTFHGHEDSVNSVSFSPDGKVLISGSDDKTIRLWDVEKLDLEVDLNDLMLRSCNWVRGYLQHNPYVEEENRNLCDNIG